MQEDKMTGKQTQSNYPLCVWYCYYLRGKKNDFKDVKALG